MFLYGYIPQGERDGMEADWLVVMINPPEVEDDRWPYVLIAEQRKNGKCMAAQIHPRVWARRWPTLFDWTIEFVE